MEECTLTAANSFSQKDIQDVLGILSGQPLPGSAIALGLAAIGNQTLKNREVYLYVLLHQMERSGLIRGRLRDTDAGMERRFYRLTARGRRRISGKPGFTAFFQLNVIPEREQSSIRTIRMRRWCSDATLGIRVSPDKELVAQEIYDHIYDRMALLILEGMDGDSAEQAVMALMGNPLDVNAPLGRLHRPFWTLALRWAQRVMAVLTVLCLFTYGLHYLETVFFRNTIVEFDSSAPPALSGTHQLLWQDKIRVTQSAEGYRIRAYQTSLWHTTSLDGDGRELLNIQLKIINPIPWSQEPDFGSWIWAEDNLGNRYVSGGLDTPAMEPAIQAIQYHTGATTYILDLWIFRYVSQNADWLDLHYDRDGRDLTLRIPLSGGELH